MAVSLKICTHTNSILFHLLYASSTIDMQLQNVWTLRCTQFSYTREKVANWIISVMYYSLERDCMLGTMSGLRRHGCQWKWLDDMIEGPSRTGIDLQNQTWFWVHFTTLHWMLGVYSRQKDVSPSVRLSVCQTRELWQNGRKICPALVFWQKEWLVEATPSTWNSGSNWPRWSEIADFQSIFARSASAVTPSEKSSVNTKSTTRFPMSPRWTSYVDHKPPKGWLKTQSVQNLNNKLR